MTPNIPENTKAYFENVELWESSILPYQKQVQEDILRILPPNVTSILDVGCGNGVITNILPKNIRVVGVDLSQSAIAHVQRETHLGSITELPFNEHSFDLVMANDIIEHLSELELEIALKELERVSSQYIILTVPFLEDLNQASVKCLHCGKFYHVNHHQRSFDLKKIQTIFGQSNIHCVKTILSGDKGSGEVPEVMFLKRLLSLDPTSSSTWLCNHCGKAYSLPEHPLSTPRLSQFFAQVNSSFMFYNTSLRDLCQAPTEIICLFEKKTSLNPATTLASIPSSGIYTSQTGSPVSLDYIRLTNRYLDFRQPSRYQKSHLPLSCFLPYFLSNSIVPEGVLVSGDNPLLFGFFTQQTLPHKPVKLRISGYAQRKSKLTISPYDDIFAYHSPVAFNVFGTFSVYIDLPETTLSKYGLLFQIIASESIILHWAQIHKVSDSSVKVYDFSKNKASLYQLPHAPSLYLGLSYETNPNELIPMSWMESPNLLRQNNFPTLSEIHPLHFVDYLRWLLEILGLKISANLDYSSTLSEQLTILCHVIESVPNELSLDEIVGLFEKKLETYYKAARLKGRISNKRQKVFQLNKGSFESYRNKILSRCHPELYDYSLFKDAIAMSTPEKSRRFLMICHDQNIDRRIVQEAQALIEQGWSGRIVCLSFDKEDAIETYEGIPVHRIGKKRLVPTSCEVYWRYQKRQHGIQKYGKNLKILYKLNWKLYKLDLKHTYRCHNIQYPLPYDLPFYCTGRIYRSDLIFAHDLTALKAAHQLSREWEVPLIYDSHEFYSEQVVFSQYQKDIMDKVEKQYAPDCDAVITVSPSIARAMSLKNNIPEPFVIMNVTDSQSDHPLSKTHLLQETLGIPLEHKIALYQGGIIQRRNLDILVEAFKKLLESGVGDVHLVLLGPAKPELLQQLKIISGEWCDRFIHFMPPVPQQELGYYTVSADFGIIPYPPIDLNTKYCMPNKTFEYIQSCLPILANDLVEIGRFILDLNGGGMVADLNSVESMLNAIKVMLTRNLPEDRERLFRIKEKYTWNVEKKSYLDIVNNVMVKHSQRP